MTVRERRVDESRPSARLKTDELPRTVGHDLRGPLMAISGAAELIAQIAPADGEAGVQIREWAGQISHGAAVMERLIRDLLDFGSLENGRLCVRAEHRDLTALVRGAANAFQSAAAAKSLTLEADFPVRPVMATYDRDRVYRVLWNLIHNAIAFTPSGGSVCVRVFRRGADPAVAVIDTGIGISSTDLITLFDRHRQLRQPEGAGLGLGLYVSKWIVEAHGGRIWAESQVGRGSTFFFTLPAD
jgi:signal transduction histidine kinase